MPDQSKYTPTSWGQPDTFDVTTPSGQVCLIRKLQMEDIVELNLIDSLDSLTGLVGQPSAVKQPMDHQKSKEQLAADAEKEQADFTNSLMKDKEKFRQMTATIDKVLTAVVIAPKIELAPAEEADKVNGVVYTSSVGFEDKMAVFEAAFDGLGNLEPFREGPSEGVGGVRTEQDVSLPSF